MPSSCGSSPIDCEAAAWPIGATRLADAALRLETAEGLTRSTKGW